MMKLYVSAGAPNPRRALMFAAEKNLLDRIEVIEISLMTGEHRSEAFRQVSPLSTVPALTTEEGTHLTEAPTICRYLESQFPEPNLLGRTEAERALIDMWDRRMEYRVMNTGALHVRHGAPFMAVLEDQIPAFSQRCLVGLERACAWLDPHLGVHEWIAGTDRPSLPDITALAGFDFARVMKFRTPADTYPNIARWRAAMSARASAQYGLPG